MPGSRWSGLARVGQHRLSSGSAHGLLGVAQACSAPSDTSRDSQFESTSSKCESHGREHSPSALLAKDGCNGLYGRFHAREHPSFVHHPPPPGAMCKPGSPFHTKLLSVTRRCAETAETCSSSTRNLFVSFRMASARANTIARGSGAAKRYAPCKTRSAPGSR